MLLAPGDRDARPMARDSTRGPRLGARAVQRHGQAYHHQHDKHRAHDFEQPRVLRQPDSAAQLSAENPHDAPEQTGAGPLGRTVVRGEGTVVPMHHELVMRTLFLSPASRSS